MNNIIKKKNNIQCGLITSYIYTIIYISENKKIIYFNYIKNNEFHSKIYILLEELLKNYDIDFFNIFLGPAPLLSCRSTLIFAQALFFSKKINIVTTQGYEYYKKSEFDYIIIQNFSQQYTIIKDNKITKITSIKDIQEKKIEKKIGLVARENHIIEIENSYNHILYPNIQKIINEGEQKYKKEKIVCKINEIKPFVY